MKHKSTSKQIESLVRAQIRKITKEPAQKNKSRVTVSKPFREILAKEYPKLGKNHLYWGFLGYLIFGTFKEKDGHLILAGEVLAEEIGISSLSNFSLEKFFEAFSTDVQLFSWTYYRYVKSKARVLVSLKWSPIIAQAIHDERYGKWFREKRVKLADGKTILKGDRSSQRKLSKKTEHYQAMNSICPDQKELFMYFASIPINSFTIILGKNLLAALAVVEKLEPLIAENQANLIHGIVDYPQPSYFPSDWTVRIFERAGISNLKREVRQALTKGWIEFDLKNAQTAIATKLWDIPILQKFLEDENNSIWTHLFERYDTPSDKEADVKDVLKTALYAVMFGAKSATVNKILKDAGLETKPFRRSKYIKAIWKAREAQLKKILADGQATTCYGIVLFLETESDGTTNERSILAQLCQSYELKLLYPVVKLARAEAAKEKPQFRIMMWQHDGFSIYIYRKDCFNSIMKRIRNAVDQRAIELQVNTHLVAKEL